MKKIWLTALFALPLVLLGGSQAEAAFKVRATYLPAVGPVVTLEAEDNVPPPPLGPGEVADLNPVASNMTVLFSIAGETFTVTALSKPLTVGARIEVVVLGTFPGIGTGTLTLDVTDTAFGPGASGIGPDAPASLTNEVTALGSPSGFTSTGFLDDSDVEYGGIDPSAGPVFSTPTLTTLGSSGTDVPSLSGGDYSLSTRLTFTRTGGASFNASAATTFATPLPPALALLLSGLPVGGLVYWRRRRAAKAA